MPVTSPQVTVFSGISGTTMPDFFATLKTHFSAGNSTKFTYSAGAVPSPDGFTLTPIDSANTYWQLNFRRTSATVAKLMIDPGKTITSPGTASATPTGASVKASPEKDAWDIATSGAAAVGNKIALVELKDALFIVHVDTGATPSFNPVMTHAGRIYVPFFSNNVVSGDGQGDNFADGLGVLGGLTRYGQQAQHLILPYYYANNSRTTARGHETGWFTPLSGGNQNVATQDGRINGKRRPHPFDVVLDNTDGSQDALIGYTKYMLFSGDPAALQYPGTRDESPTDAWIRVNYSSGTTAQLIPWDLTTTPPF